MSATNYVGHRSGEVNATGNSRALFLKLYAGEVMTAFQTKNIMLDYCRVRTIKNGKSAQFIMTGKNRAAAYHTPGNELVPAARAKHTERLVTIDDLLVAHQFIPNIDEAMQHFDIRSVYTDEASYGLAKVADKNILRMAIKAAIATDATKVAALVQDNVAWTDEDFTANVAYATLANSMKADYFLDGIVEAKRILEMAGAPLDGMVCVVATDLYYNMFKTAGISKETGLHMFDKDIGGGASVTDVNIPTIAGIPVVRTPHLGTGNASGWTNSLWTVGGSGSNLTGTTNDAAPLGSAESNRAAVYDLPATYMNTAQQVRALVMHKDAVATVKLMDLSVESEYQINRQGTLLVAKYAMGHNVLRPAMAVALTAPVA